MSLLGDALIQEVVEQKTKSKTEKVTLSPTPTLPPNCTRHLNPQMNSIATSSHSGGIPGERRGNNIQEHFTYRTHHSHKTSIFCLAIFIPIPIPIHNTYVLAFVVYSLPFISHPPFRIPSPSIPCSIRMPAVRLTASRKRHKIYTSKKRPCLCAWREFRKTEIPCKRLRWRVKKVKKERFWKIALSAGVLIHFATLICTK
ncbi:hypothetical protein EJ04DRAFT_249436 [Polyplosphaeria fusca]|uniref:Uncharacterized protein n=1 Tax=Polyplosphaeria fusca TaxID=682080 RepID=A0A9P4V2H2_9PLEO|nr:hypothetical protein EJ04DRAFT_249436 [Polyplosphaeria fusca]